jgi:DNA-binding response OmpR family regulator
MVMTTSLARVLIVDDEPRICSFIGRALSAAGYAADTADAGAVGLRLALEGGYDLIILDLVMPDIDGRQVLSQVMTAHPDQAVIVLSCVADVSAKVDCLDRGAQDYLTKPFSLGELLARVRLRLRGETAVPHPEVLRAGGVMLDTGRLAADVGHGPVPLTRLEFLLLRELAARPGQSVAKGRLLAAVWGYDFDPGSNVVDVCVRRLRSKLGFDLIKTVRGEGYQLVVR